MYYNTSSGTRTWQVNTDSEFINGCVHITLHGDDLAIVCARGVEQTFTEYSHRMNAVLLLRIQVLEAEGTRELFYW